MPPPKAPAVCVGPKDVIRDRSRIRLRVICVPQAGMGAWAFHEWQDKMPPEVEVLPVEPPGRNSRMMDPKPTTMGEMVSGLAAGLANYGAFDMPYVLLGHSLGAWVAFELCMAQKRSGGRLPSLLIVSGIRAPHLYGLDHDADRVQPSISQLPDVEFWTHFERRYGVNPDLEDAMVKGMVIPLLRADFGILESYEPTVGKEPLPCPVIACAAVGDNRVAPGQLAEWKEYTNDTDSFREERFETRPLPWSTPHRYLVETPASFQAFLGRECTAIVRALAEAEKKSAAEAVEAARAKAEVEAAKAKVKPDEAKAGYSVATLLSEANCDQLASQLTECTIGDLVGMLTADGRPGFLNKLKELGISKLAERQAIANTLGKVQREGRV